MKLKQALTSSFLVLPLLVGSVNYVNAEEASVKEKGFIVEFDKNQLEDQLEYVNQKIQTITDPEKLENLEKSKALIEEQLAKTETKGSNGGFSTQALNKDHWFASEGAHDYNSNRSSHEPDHVASIEVTLDDVNSGFDWSGESRSDWYGENPEKAYSLKNTLTFSANGVAISGSLSGISFSGATSGSSTVTASRSNAIAARNLFDAFSSGSTIKAVFASSSALIKTSGSATDSTSAQITYYDPGY
ncbi:hypothetical protein OIN60_15680 [Paenibacillus sp. P96]|uniref:Uncharacterized protein n=1 Tax=Paenibacillus zeirhizosphaerae TaxID=2987519 RepID=A0ABT9FTY8_9BACL|nr:hypothetical protein [Paenibacillus sp. P96]MDP4098198.1 hypothetical protein [Paenibacillus sp. P96]